ncbi:MAG: hypothetical protein JXB26_08745 [Candidatus Aminicenantes bacterium]|nr:hypothetical protein [Candidatus Aminicenantes bacterium]
MKFFKFILYALVILFFLYILLVYFPEFASKPIEIPLKKTKKPDIEPVPQEQPEHAKKQPMKLSGHKMVSYRFADENSRRYEFIYYIPQSQINDSQKNFGYSRREIYELLSQHIRQYNEKYKEGFHAHLNQNLSLRVTYDKEFLDVYNTFMREHEQKILDYCRKRYIHVTFKKGGRVLSVDFPAVQLWQSEYVRPLYQKLRRMADEFQLDSRQFTILLAKFVQYLRYKIPPPLPDFENFGFWPPVICLSEKAGDCDSKSTLFATIYYHYRKNSCILIRTENHAFIGIKSQHKIYPRDNIMRFGGMDYFLIETTSLHNLGYIPSALRSRLKNGPLDYVVFH